MSKILYNEQHIIKIANKYKECAEILSDAIANQEKAKSTMSINYKGMATNITTDCFDKIEEHLNLLVACCDTSQTYVKDSLEAMQQIDTQYFIMNKEGYGE